jgi:hypothetical protein
LKTQKKKKKGGRTSKINKELEAFLLYPVMICKSTEENTDFYKSDTNNQKIFRNWKNYFESVKIPYTNANIDWRFT